MQRALAIVQPRGFGAVQVPIFSYEEYSSCSKNEQIRIFRMEKQKTLITSALPYANGPLHFGHIAGAYLPADCYARFKRLCGDDVFYVCGSDEYGVAITLTAETAGRSPRDHVDIFHEVNRRLFKKLRLSFDHFSRTTCKDHEAPVHQYFKDLLANGFIEKQETKQLYSETDKRFFADRYVVGTCPKCSYEDARGDECTKCGASYDATELKHPRAKTSGAHLVLKSTEHWFLLLDKFKEKLTEWISQKNWKPNVLKFAQHYIENLRPRGITRDLDWGIPVPLKDASGKVLYVWFDAPIGYISASMEWARLKGAPDTWKDYWCDPRTKLVNFIGKDNIPFHAVIFPAMTMGQNQPYKLVDELPANEFYNLEGRQFSKSEGWYIDLDDFFARYTVDQIRYTIAANAPESADSEFTWKDFQMRCNSELLGKYGNLVNRSLVFAQMHCEGKVPTLDTLQEIDKTFLKEIRLLVDEAAGCFEGFKLRRASQLVMELAQLGNIYFDAKKPWQTAKSPETRGDMVTTIACCIECLKCLALISSPIIPETAQKVWLLLGYSPIIPETAQLEKLSWGSVVAHAVPFGQALPKPGILFQKIEDLQIAAEIAKLHTMAQTTQMLEQTPAPIAVAEVVPFREPISIDAVMALDLRVAQILEAAPVPKSKKLMCLKVDLGNEKRTIVAGIGRHYKAEQLIGKKVVVVANLQPAKLMGVESQGMVLAGSSGALLEVLSINSLPPGSVVK